MDEITRVIKEMFWLLQNVNVAEEDYKVIGISQTNVLGLYIPNLREYFTQHLCVH